jgi:hypothetical protein
VQWRVTELPTTGVLMRSDDEQQPLVSLQENEPPNTHVARRLVPAMTLQVRGHGALGRTSCSWHVLRRAVRTTWNHQAMTLGPALRKSMVGRVCIQPPCCSLHRQHRAPVLLETRGALPNPITHTLRSPDGRVTTQSNPALTRSSPLPLPLPQ